MPDDRPFRRDRAPRPDPRREAEESAPDHRRVSSNDLLLEQLAELLEERRRNAIDGITIRALNRQLSEHVEADERRHAELDERIRKIAESAAETTGRLHIPPPAPLPVIINGAGSGGKRSSHPFLGGILSDPKKVAALIGAATVLAHAIIRLLPH